VDAGQLDYLIGHPAVQSITLNKSRRARVETGAASPTPPAGTQEGSRFMKADLAWARGVTGRSRVVLVADDGIFAAHEMFAGKIAAEACFSPRFESGDQSLCPNGAESATGSGAASACTFGGCLHGSHVAGIAAGLSPTVRGVAFDARLIPVEIFTSIADPTVCGSSRCLGVYDSATISALDYAIDQASTFNIDAVNLSIGGDPVTATCDDDPLKPAIDTLRSLGILTAIAAGNEGQLGIVDPPGCISTAITVSSVSVTEPDPATNQGPTVDILAPGVNILSAGPPNTYVFRTGSSMATAQVSGIITLLKSAKPSATATEVETALKTGGIPTRASGWTWVTPRVDVNAELNQLLGIAGAPAGVAVTGVHTSMDTTTISFLRFHNAATDASSPVAVTVLDDTTGNRLGVWSLTVPSRASIQVGIRNIEYDAAPRIVPSASMPAYTLYVDSPMIGHVQHVSWNPGGGSITNLTGCLNGVSADTRTMINVHTSLVQSYPSYLVIHNTGATTSPVRLEVQDSRNGLVLGSYTAVAGLAPLATATVNVSGAIEALGLRPGTDQNHVNLVLDSNFTGFAQHLVVNQLAQLISNMTAKCDL
jgi:hypothetical protein